MMCTPAERLALTLLELGQDFGVYHLEGLRLTVSVRHKNLAELVGASRPRITEHLAHFESSHMIERKGRDLIVKRDRLESFLLQAHRDGGVHEADGRAALLGK